MNAHDRTTLRRMREALEARNTIDDGAARDGELRRHVLGVSVDAALLMLTAIEEESDALDAANVTLHHARQRMEADIGRLADERDLVVAKVGELGGMVATAEIENARLLSKLNALEDAMGRMVPLAKLEAAEQHVAILGDQIAALAVEMDDEITSALRIGELLSRTCDALKGTPPVGTLYTTHDLPEVATALRTEHVQCCALLGRYLDIHCANADVEGVSALCECKLCLDTRAFGVGNGGATPQPVDATGRGRFLLNGYGRECWDRGYAAANEVHAHKPDCAQRVTNASGHDFLAAEIACDCGGSGV